MGKTRLTPKGNIIVIEERRGTLLGEEEAAAELKEILGAKLLWPETDEDNYYALLDEGYAINLDDLNEISHAFDTHNIDIAYNEDNGMYTICIAKYKRLV